VITTKTFFYAHVCKACLNLAQIKLSVKSRDYRDSAKNNNRRGEAVWKGSSEKKGWKWVEDEKCGKNGAKSGCSAHPAAPQVRDPVSGCRVKGSHRRVESTPEESP
jgi:hypothetical protein